MSESDRSGPELASVPQLGVRRTAAEEIAHVLRRAIVQGVFDDGDELNQVALSRYFGVSRVPIREALRELQAEGLVTSRAHMRSVVNGLRADVIVEIFDLRALLEVSLAERSCTRIQPTELERLLALCDDMDEAGSHDDWLAGNREFHEAMCAPSGASLTIEVLRQLGSQVERYLRIWSPARLQRREEANREHRRIVQALMDGEAGLLRVELHGHIQRTSELTLELFRRSRVTRDENLFEVEETGDPGLPVGLESVARRREPKPDGAGLP